MSEPTTEELKSKIKSLEAQLEKASAKRRRYQTFDSLDSEVKGLKTELQTERARRRRVVAVFLALRDVKSLDRDLEPVLLAVLNKLAEFPGAMLPFVAAEQRERAEKLAVDRVTQIRIHAKKRVAQMNDAPRTPANARYIVASQDLEPGDLDLK
jgi:predicted RNase H-like nuclease (RuvC/YqgF family)